MEQDSGCNQRAESGLSLSKCNNYYSKDKSEATVRKMLNDLIAPKIDYRRALRMYLAEKMSKRKRSYGRQSRFSGSLSFRGM